MLTTAMKQVYAFPASPYCEAGFDIPNEKRHSRTPCGFFVSIAQPPVMTGCVEQPQGWPVLFPVCQLRTVRLPMFDIFVRRVFNLLQRKAIMNTLALTISEISIRQDGSGRYCLNDLHKAAGNDLKHQPSNFLRIDTTKGLIEELSSSDMRNITPVETIQGKGKQQGTFVVKELVYAYAMWISAKFHIAVIRAYDALVTGQLTGNTEQLPEPKTKKALPGGLSLDQQDTIKALVKSRAEDLPKDKQASAIIKQWAAIKQKFGCTYKEVSPDNFVNIISLLSRLPMEGELLPKQQHNSVTVTLAPLENRKTKRWLITQACDEMVVMMSLDDDKEVMTKEQFIKELQHDNHVIAERTAHGVRSMVMDFLPIQVMPVLIEAAMTRMQRCNWQMPGA